MRSTSDPLVASLRQLAPEIAKLLGAIIALERASDSELAPVTAAQVDSARNLVHYLALRRQDLRELQDQLAAVGLSSLGRAEPAVAHTLGAITRLVTRVTGEALPELDDRLSLTEGRRRLSAHAADLLGPPPRDRHTRIMVTLPSEAAHDVELVRGLVAGGMNLARINCAHDDEDAWASMIKHVRAAARDRGVPVRIHMDLAGPKLRTGALPPGPHVLKLKPLKDACGMAVAPARAWLTPEAARVMPPERMPVIPIAGDRLGELKPGALLGLQDARGSERTLEVVGHHKGGCLVTVLRTTYLQEGAALHAGEHMLLVGALPPVATALSLVRGDRFALTASAAVATGELPAIPCSLPSVFADVRAGERIFFDDGAIGGRIIAVQPDHLEVEVLEAPARGVKLRADKGINLPDTKLRLPSLEPDDLAHLGFIARHADLIGYSFVRRPEDIVELHERLSAAGRRDLGIVLKIETRDAFEQLPRLLLAAMRRPHVGVMIARGDLAVECGWERLAEVQEELLWMCEAAHVPVIWATQVLEKLAKEGKPSRAEITDAAMSVRAECVMLNKGPHVVTAVHVLDDIVRRMEEHQDKKRPMLRPLGVAERFAAGVQLQRA